MMKNLVNFLEEKKIKFTSEQQSLRWVRRLKTKSLVRIGLSYFVDEEELSKLLEEHLQKKQKQRAKQISSGKEFAAKNLIRKKSVLKKVVNEKDKG